MIRQRSSFLLFCMSMAIVFMSCNGASDEKKEKAADTPAVAVESVPAAPAPVNTIITTAQLSVMITHKVSNFSKWLLAYEADDSLRLANGLHSYVIGRGVNDSNTVFVVLRADDLEKAKARVSDPGFKKIMQKAGVVGSPEIGVYSTVWQDTANVGSVIRSRTTFSVKDWGAWEKNFKDGKQERLDNGITDRAYGHLVGDDKKISLVTALLDTTKAFAYYKSDALKKRRADGGVVGDPKRFLFQIVKRY